MRSQRWILLATMIGLLIVGCNGKLTDNGDPKDTAASPITSISAPVVGFVGTADTAFEARDFGTGELLGSGMLNAATLRFEATFRPLAEVPASVLFQFDPDDAGYGCDVTVTPETLRIVGTLEFERVDGDGFVVLSTFDYRVSQAAPVGSRSYLFLLADRAARIEGTCEDPSDGETAEFALNLARGWNSVAAVVTQVDAMGFPIGQRFQNEKPTAEARWFYVGFDMEYPD